MKVSEISKMLEAIGDDIVLKAAELYEDYTLLGENEE